MTKTKIETKLSNLIEVSKVEQKDKSIKESKKQLRLNSKDFSNAGEFKCYKNWIYKFMVKCIELQNVHSVDSNKDNIYIEKRKETLEMLQQIYTFINANCKGIETDEIVISNKETIKKMVAKKSDLNYILAAMYIIKNDTATLEKKLYIKSEGAMQQILEYTMYCKRTQINLPKAQLSTTTETNYAKNVQWMKKHEVKTIAV